MSASRFCLIACFFGLASPLWPVANSLAAAPPSVCHRALVDGEVRDGQSFSKSLGNGLEIYLQPIASGWIIRIIPEAGSHDEMDYAQVATPPYDSVTPLSISTDFAFRAQDAIGWNPRRFNFVADRFLFDRLLRIVRTLPRPPARAPLDQEVELGDLLSNTAKATFEILDARLTPGTSDQTPTAAAVASHFSSTAHTLDLPHAPTPLGRLSWIRFRLKLDLPASFRPAPGVKLESLPCKVRPTV